MSKFVLGDAGLLDGLEPAIIKFAKETWNYIPENQRRHTDIEDVLQEARLRAWKAVTRFDPSKGVKLSTWVIGTLAKTMREVNAPYTNPKRNGGRVGTLIDIDDPDANVNIAADDYTEITDAVEAFQNAITHVDDAGREMLFGALGLVTVRIKPAVAGEVYKVAQKYRLSASDIKKLRKVLVTHKGNSMSKVPQIECVVCGELYPVTDVGKTVDAKTLVCKTCVEQRVADATTCLGKQYDPNAKECIGWCPDRITCKRISLEGSYMGVNKPETVEEHDPFADADVAGESVGDLSLVSEDIEAEPEDEDDSLPDGMDAAVSDDVQEHTFGEDDSDDVFEDDDDAEDAVTDFPDDDAGNSDDSVDLSTTADVDVFAEPEPKPQPVKAAQPSRQKAQESVATSKPAAPAKKPATTGGKLTLVKSTSKPVPAPVKSAAKKTAPVKTVVAKKTATAPAKKTAPVKVAAKTAVKTVAKKTPAKATKPVKAAAKGTDKPKRQMKKFKPQYWTGQSPYRPETHLQTLFDKATSADGLKLKDLEKYADKHKLVLRGLTHNLSKGHSFNNEWGWTYSNKDGVIRIKITKKPSAEYRKACGPPKVA